MHRFFVDPHQISGDTAALSPEQAHQVSRVLRLQPGDSVCVLDGSGRECPAVLEELAPQRATARLGAWRDCPAEPAAWVTLGLGILKGERMEWAVQKATEAGVAEIVPAQCARSVVRVEKGRAAGKTQRWQKVAREAAEQCRRGRVPPVRPPVAFSELLAHAPQFGRVVLADEAETTPLAGALAGRPRRVLLLVGPEGGFTPEEAAAARAAGAVPVSLGARVLRAETAAVVGVALVLHELERSS